LNRAARGADTIRSPSLDGLRAVSILLVVSNHLMFSATAPQFIGWVSGAIDAGALGVRVFFVLSGFLITGILARELQRTGTLSLRQFYLRRALRIFPASYVFLIVVAALAAVGVMNAARTELLSAATYTLNFWPGRPAWEVAHLWSLAVEEQFYLLWPVTLLLLGVRRGAVLAALLLAGVPLLRVARVLGMSWHVLDLAAPFVMFADWLAVGALLALAGSQLARWERYRALRASNLWTLFLLVSALAAWTALGHWRTSQLTSVWTAIAIALVIDQLTAEPHCIATRVLAVPPMAWIGRISYSLYLWQEVFCYQAATTTWWTQFPTNVVLAFTCATLSYHAIERPVLAWRDRARHA